MEGGSTNDRRLLQLTDVTKYFPVRTSQLFGTKRAYVRAVDGVSFSVREGETFGIVGESGCGKTTLSRLILRLIDLTSGSIWFEGEELSGLNKKQVHLMRKHMQIVFQDPYASLSPRMKAVDIIAEPLRAHRQLARRDKKAIVQTLLQEVGLDPGSSERYPHEFSGGQRQRVGIARALSMHPKLIVCDEPVSALDVSIQAQILNLLQDLQVKYDLTYVFIAHDLSVIEHICDRIAVMYLGKLVELATKQELYENPLHPYTRALISAVPIAERGVPKREKMILKGDVPSPVSPPSGCRFHTRCPYAMDVCKETEPELVDQGEGHLAACHLHKSTPEASTKTFN